MMKWVVKYIDNNKEEWEKRKSEQEQIREEKENEKEDTGRHRNIEKTKSQEEIREERKQKAKLLKESWKMWRKPSELDLEDKEEYAKGLENEEEDSELLGEKAKELCLMCAHTPCLCIITRLEERISMVGKIRKALEEKETKKEKKSLKQKKSKERENLPKKNMKMKNQKKMKQ